MFFRVDRSNQVSAPVDLPALRAGLGEFDRQGRGDGLHGLRQVVGREDAADFGFHEPVADNGTAVGRAMNRRIEIFVAEPPR